MIATIMQQRQENEAQERSHISYTEQYEKNASQWAKMATLWEERNNEEAAKGAREAGREELQNSRVMRNYAEKCRQKIEETTRLIQALVLEQEQDRKKGNETEEFVFHNND
jgi:hypothetical protein